MWGAASWRACNTPLALVAEPSRGCRGTSTSTKHRRLRCRESAGRALAAPLPEQSDAAVMMACALMPLMPKELVPALEEAAGPP